MLAKIIAAILLPPLGSFLARGIGPAFWLTLALTILFWVPGIVLALIAVIRPDILPRRIAGSADDSRTARA
jgi:uncharacterized membrane protein YqaE (UPF0057 family)